MGTEDRGMATGRDAFFKKLVSLRYAGQTLHFRVSQDLFSSHRVDFGTSFLLRTLVPSEHAPFRKVLDLGCGYGAIGLALKKVFGESFVHMVDRDALAVEYSRQNAELNGLSDVEVYGSLGYDDVRAEDFDLIACNIPGKAGEPVISHFLRDTADYLRPGGMVAVVVVIPLQASVEQVLTGTPGIDIVFRGTRSGHAVFHYRFTDNRSGADRPRMSALDREVYHRTKETFSFQGPEYPMQTAWGLPEFDSRSYHTELLLEGIQGLRNQSVRRVVVFNPGQGHVPVVLSRLIKPDRIVLVDRDLLSLRYSMNNLALNGYSAERVTLSHQVGIALEDGEQADIIAGTLRENEGTEALALTTGQAADQLSPDGVFLLSAGSTSITRVEGAIRTRNQLRIQERKRWKGNSLLIARHK